MHFACLNASKTAASVLARSVAYHLQEAKQEADVAEASEYKDEIKADIKAWAFSVRTAFLYTMYPACCLLFSFRWQARHLVG